MTNYCCSVCGSSDETTLLSCPFCGGEARYYAPGPIDHHIECVECYADIHRDTEAEAIAAWNTRAELGSEREIELGNALNEKAEKWAIAQIEVEDYAKRCILLEELITDMFLTWKRLDLEGDWPHSGHNGYRVFEQRLKQLNLID